MNINRESLFAEILTILIVIYADLRRRQLPLARLYQLPVSVRLDIGLPALGLGIAASLTVELVLKAVTGTSVGWRSPELWIVAAYTAIFLFCWREGRRQIQFQRPRGLIAAEWIILAGAIEVITSAFFRFSFWFLPGVLATSLGVAVIAIGVIVIARIVPPFVRKGSEYHRILQHHAEQGESIQQEYAAPTPECPNPSQWKMVDSQTTELEVLDFLKVLVTTLKPSLILETGTFLGYGTIKLAEGARANGSGRVITVEYDPVIFARARERIEGAGLSDWVECRNESSLETKIEGTIDFYFSDSALAMREQEIRRLLPQVSNHGLIAIHDASSQFEVVREAALRMEREGLLSVVLLSTPRGLVLAQKRPGRA